MMMIGFQPLEYLKTVKDQQIVADCRLLDDWNTVEDWQTKKDWKIVEDWKTMKDGKTSGTLWIIDFLTSQSYWKTVDDREILWKIGILEDG